jgi:hypothetical protein
MAATQPRPDIEYHQYREKEEIHEVFKSIADELSAISDQLHHP